MTTIFPTYVVSKSNLSRVHKRPDVVQTRATHLTTQSKLYARISVGMALFGCSNLVDKDRLFSSPVVFPFRWSTWGAVSANFSKNWSFTVKWNCWRGSTSTVPKWKNTCVCSTLQISLGMQHDSFELHQPMETTVIVHLLYFRVSFCHAVLVEHSHWALIIRTLCLFVPSGMD